MNIKNLSKKELIKLVKKLKKKKNAIILVHNYQLLEVQEIADFVGDSLQLAKEAAQTDADIILFCGVLFMAETAKILSPQKKVLLSHPDAGCPMADMITSTQLKILKSEYPGAEVVCYVNSSAEVKAESTVCCTSSNAVKIVGSIPKNKEIIFVPDKNLGSYAAFKNNRKLILWDGYCYVHHNITYEDVKEVRKKYPSASWRMIVHPECRPEVIQNADAVGSTSQIIEFVKNHNKVIIGTEIGLYHQLAHKYSDKKLVPLSEKMICKNMKKTDLRTAIATLVEEKNEISLPDTIIEKAKKSLERMLLFS